jgi:hypothetical protein
MALSPPKGVDRMGMQAMGCRVGLKTDGMNRARPEQALARGAAQGLLLQPQVPQATWQIGPKVRQIPARGDDRSSARRIADGMTAMLSRKRHLLRAVATAVFSLP